MVYRLSWIAGAGGVLLALMRLGRLLEAGEGGVPWQAILMVCALLGSTITWAGLAYRLDGRLVAFINLTAVTITAVRVAVPATTWLIFPTLSSFTEMRLEIEFARQVIRAGVAPVLPLAGVVAILAVIFWGLGALLSWGLLTGRPYLAVLFPLVVYLQFATMDRNPGSGWLWLFLLFLGAALLAVALDRRRDSTGLLTGLLTRRSIPRSFPTAAVSVIAAAFLVALVSTQAVAGSIPRSGLLTWRVQSGLTGDYFGGVSYNPFVSIQQGLLSPTNAPVFVAAVDGPVDPDDVYWRLMTLETFNGDQWYADDPLLRLPEDVSSFESPDQVFRGATKSVTQDVTILALEMGWLPAAYAPVDIGAANPTVDSGLRVRDDGSLRFGDISYRGMTYTVRSEIPVPDLAVLAIGPDGQLTPVFRGAADDGVFAEPSSALVPNATGLADDAVYLALPADLDPGMATLAMEQTESLTSDFEKGLALETFFRSNGGFTYSADIDPGHGAEDLAAWLLDPDSPNYRTGYCEQFATGMAVMARQVGIPSRVALGFTPGDMLDDGRVVVRDRNAHAWVELWMPTQGWVRFDPTPRGDGVNRSAGGDLPFAISEYLDVAQAEAPPITAPSGTPAGTPTIPENTDLGGTGADASGGDGSGSPVPPWMPWAALGSALLLGLVPAIKAVRYRMRMRRLAAGDITAAWREAVDRLDDLGVHPEATATPMEAAADVSPVMIPLAEVYGQRLYGDPALLPDDAVAVAARSLADTRQALAFEFSRPRRVLAAYRMVSLVPGWMRRRFGRS